MAEQPMEAAQKTVVVGVEDLRLVLYGLRACHPEHPVWNSVRRLRAAIEHSDQPSPEPERWERKAMGVRDEFPW